MTHFLDGPAAGVTLALRRAPLFLRVVHSKRHGWDALDLVEDLPRFGERVYAYRLVLTAGAMHLRAGKASGWYKVADYALCATQPDDATTRRNDKWRAWCLAQHELRKAAAAPSPLTGSTTDDAS